MRKKILTLFATGGGWSPLEAIVASVVVVVVVVVTGEAELLAGVPKLGHNIHLHLRIKESSKRLKTKKVFKKKKNKD